MKVSELTGAQLDWAVAKCEEPSGRDNSHRFLRDHRIGFTTRYSETWSQGGPIIERECIYVLPPVIRRIGAERHAFPVDYWRAMLQRDENESVTHGRGPTPLIAAMRCFVSCKLGYEIEIPEELK